MLLKDFLRVFLRSWGPAPDLAVRHLWRRWLVLVVLWPLLALILLINGLGLALDHVLFARFRRVVVNAPVFVLGVPRSGTTFVHRLLALDADRFTTTALWELVFAPSITQRYFWTGVVRLDRMLGRPLGRCLYWLERRALGGLDDIHSTGLAAPEEDYLALAHVLGCFLQVLPFPESHQWQLAYADTQLDPARKARLMRFYRRFVQRHLWFHGTDKTFLSKNPSFTPMLNMLADEFPDARFVACFRNPSKAVPSQINSILVGARIFRGRHIDPEYWRERLSEMLQFYYRHLFETMPRRAERRHAHMLLERLAPDPEMAMLALYEAFGWRPSAAYAAALRAQSEQARGYRSAHQYSLTELAIAPERLERDFGFVYHHFGYPLPSAG